MIARALMGRWALLVIGAAWVVGTGTAFGENVATFESETVVDPTITSRTYQDSAGNVGWSMTTDMGNGQRMTTGAWTSPPRRGGHGPVGFVVTEDAEESDEADE